MTEATVAPPQKTSDITKIEAVRLAMSKMAKDASRADLQAYIKDQFGYEMSLAHITDCKKKLKKRSQDHAKKPATPKTPQAAAAPPTPTQAVTKAVAPKAATGNGKSNDTFNLTDIEKIQGLVGRVGPNQLRSLVDLLAK